MIKYIFNYYSKLILLFLFCMQLPATAIEQNQISQFGITWNFDKDYTVGQFANGDYWIVGPVTIINISPESVEVEGRILNGSMINPSPKLDRKQGYDSKLYGNYNEEGDYDPNLNAARPGKGVLSQSNPLVIKPDSSLVSTRSTDQVEGSTRIQTAAVLTVLSSIPEEGSFRPAYCSSDKAIRFNKKQLNYDLLASLKPVLRTPQMFTVEQYFEKPWIDHIPLWLGRSVHPVDNMPDYGREMATQVGIGALMLNLDFTNQQKETLLIRYIQLGIDLYGIIKDGGEKNWIGMGGHANGRKFPILFAGCLLDDPNMKYIGTKSGDYLYYDGHGPGNPPADYIHFGEDDQTFYVSKLDIEVTNSEQWNPDRRDIHRIPYEVSDIGLPEWGIVHSIDPEQSNKYWETMYRRVSSPCWGGIVLAVHIMDLMDLWNHDALFDYKDRYMQIPTNLRETSAFVENMWDEYRNDYGPVWTMKPTLDIKRNNGVVIVLPNIEYYDLGQIINLKAVANPGYIFTEWIGDITTNTTGDQLCMYANQSIEARFELVTDTQKDTDQ